VLEHLDRDQVVEARQGTLEFAEVVAEQACAGSVGRRFGPESLRARLLIRIQVFQHGADADVATYFEKVGALLRPGGLFFLR